MYYSAILKRFLKTDKYTIGEMQIIDDDGRIILQCYTLELPYRNNEVQKSCIPLGIYELVKHTSPKFGLCIYVKSVPNRSHILIHAGNKFKDTLGCILVGSQYLVTGDYRDGQVTNSKYMLQRILNINFKSITLKITESC